VTCLLGQESSALPSPQGSIIICVIFFALLQAGVRTGWSLSWGSSTLDSNLVEPTYVTTYIENMYVGKYSGFLSMGGQL
jgi:hypothetical protein